MVYLIMKPILSADILSLKNTSCTSIDEDGEVPSYTEFADIPKKNFEQRVFQSLRRITRVLELHSRRLTVDYQITGPQLACLLALKENEPLTIKKLAQSAYLSPSTIVGIVDRLEEKGLVHRSRSVIDRRSVLITVTENGHYLLSSAPSPIQESLARTLAALPEQEKGAITFALEKVADLMEARDLDANPPLESGQKR